MSRIPFVSVAAAIGLAMLSSASEAAVRKPPVDSNCLEWVRYKMSGNWTNSPAGDYWLCIRGPKSGAKVAVQGSAGRPSGTSGSTDGDVAAGKPGWGLGAGGHVGPRGQQDGKEHPPGHSKW